MVPWDGYLKYYNLGDKHPQLIEKRRKVRRGSRGRKTERREANTATSILAAACAGALQFSLQRAPVRHAGQPT